MFIYTGLMLSFAYVLMLVMFPVWDGRHLIVLALAVTALVIGFFRQGRRDAAR